MEIAGGVNMFEYMYEDLGGKLRHRGIRGGNVGRLGRWAEP